MLSRRPGFVSCKLDRAASKALRASRYQALSEPIDCIALTVADDVTVDLEGYTYIAMAELISDNGDRGSALDQFRRDRVPERVKSDAAHLQGFEQRAKVKLL